MKRYIFAGIILGISLLGYGCGHMENQPEQDTVEERTQEEESVPAADEEIIFKSAAIEEKTRELLGKTDGAITRSDVLAITEFEMEAECAAPFEDLQWFENLETVSLSRRGVEKLDGVEKLTALKTLWVSDNDITDISPIKNLTNLESFSCESNPVSDYSPLRGLTGLKDLSIGYWRSSYTNIEAVSGLTNLTSLYAPMCGVSDISALENLTALEFVNLSRNRIKDISALEKLEKLTFLNLQDNQISDITPLGGLTALTRLDLNENKISDITPLGGLTALTSLDLSENKISDITPLGGLKALEEIDLQDNRISDITPLYGLDALMDIDLWENEIPGEMLADFMEQRNSALTFTVTQKGRLREDMPEFTFYLTAYWNVQWGSYALQSIEVCEGDAVLQTISIPELSLSGQTQIYQSDKEALGFGLEDVNFDGYLDIRQYDAPNGNYLQEWIYLVWNPEKQMFEHDERLSRIPLASFDQEEQLIYGMARGGAMLHYYSTYQYIDGEPVKIRYEEEEGIFLSDYESREFFIAASGKDEATPYEGFWLYIHVMERNEATGELETVSEEYVFESDGEEEELRVDVASELGQQITEACGR